MALETQAKEGMPTKQKAMIGAVIIIVLIVIWQVMGLMGGGSSTPAPVAIKPVNQSQSAKSVKPAPSSAMNAVNTQPVQQTELRQAQVATDPQFLQLQRMNEEKYIGKINDLEDLKVQRAIAETNQAIATAKLATVTAEKSISDLLTKPTVAEVPAGVYANKLANPAAQTESSAGPPPIAQTADYTVISVSMQLGRWSAVLGYQGKLYNVIVGDILTADRSVVTNINKSGVVLRKDGTSRKVSIMSAI